MSPSSTYRILPLILLQTISSPGHEGKHPAPEPVVTDAPSAVEQQITGLTARTVAPDASPGDWIRLGDALMQLQRERVGHDFTAAATAYKQALKINPDHPDALVGMAWVSNSDHDFEKGAEWARKALAANPTIHDAHALLGDGAVELGDYDAAFHHYEDAVNLRPDLSSYSRSAHLLWLAGNAAHAESFMQKAIDAGGPYPENAAWCRAELALMQLNTGVLLAATQQAEKAYAAAPRNPRVLNILGLVRMAQGKFPEALECFEKSTAVTANHDALTGIVDASIAMGDSEKAESATADLLAFHDGHSHAHGQENHHHAVGGNAQLARFLADHDLQPERALEEAEAAFKTYKNIPVTDTLAWAYYKNGDFENARRTILRITKWKTQDPRIHYHLGMIQLASGNREPARKALESALALNPRFHPAEAKSAVDALATISAARRDERSAANKSGTARPADVPAKN